MQQCCRSAILLKRDFNAGVFPWMSRIFRTVFLLNNYNGCFWVMFYYQKELLTKKVLISLFNVQIQVSTSRSTATRASVFLAKSTESFYHKIFEHEHLSIRTKHLRQWRCYSQWKSALSASIIVWLFLPNLMTVAPL